MSEQPNNLVKIIEAMKKIIKAMKKILNLDKGILIYYRNQGQTMQLNKLQKMLKSEQIEKQMGTDCFGRIFCELEL